MWKPGDLMGVVREAGTKAAALVNEGVAKLKGPDRIESRARVERIDTASYERHYLVALEIEAGARKYRLYQASQITVFPLAHENDLMGLGQIRHPMALKEIRQEHPEFAGKLFPRAEAKMIIDQHTRKVALQSENPAPNGP